MKESLYKIKLRFEDVYFNYNKLMLSLARILFGLFIFLFININLGVYPMLKSPAIAILLGVIAGFIPLPLTMVIAFALIGVHLFKMSIILLGAYVVLLALMYLLVFRICSDKWIIVFASIILFWIKMPYLIPILLGTVFSTSVIIPGTFATLLALFLDMAMKYKEGLDANTIGAISSTFVNFAKDVNIILWISITIIVTLIVSIIKTFNIKNCKEIAIVVGGIVELIVFFAVSIILKVNVNLLLVVILIALSTIIAIAFLWMFFPFNYKATEYLEFYDDEYYYCVRAIPLSKTKRDSILNDGN